MLKNKNNRSIWEGSPMSAAYYNYQVVLQEELTITDDVINGALAYGTVVPGTVVVKAHDENRELVLNISFDNLGYPDIILIGNAIMPTTVFTHASRFSAFTNTIVVVLSQPLPRGITAEVGDDWIGRNWAGFPTNYALKNIWEFMADCFSQYKVRNNYEYSNPEEFKLMQECGWIKQ